MSTAPAVSLRDEQVERTRERILDAAVALLAEGRIGSAERALAPLLEGLPEEEQRRAVAAVYSLHSVGTYLLYRDSFGLSSREACEAAGWSVGLVIDDLERRAQQRTR